MAKSATKTAKNKNLDSKSIFYLVEYVISLIVVGGLLIVGSSFANSIIRYFLDGTASEPWAVHYQYTSSLNTLSSAFVLSAVWLFLARRIRQSESADTKMVSNQWRNLILGLFLVILSVAAIVLAVSIFHALLSMVAGVGEDSSWGAMLGRLIGLLLVGSTLFVYSRDYRSHSGSKKLRLAHHYGLVGFVLAASVLFVLFPMQSQRGGYLDGLKVQDINVLRDAVQSYYQDNQELPDSLSELNTSALQNSLDNYDYTKADDSFELCATFETDASIPERNQPPVKEDPYFEAENAQFAADYHEAGYQCFEYEADFSFEKTYQAL